MSEAHEFLSSVGRIVWGKPGQATKKTDQQSKKPILKDGQEVEQWVFGIAIPKADFLANEWTWFNHVATSVFKNGVPQGFSWKFKDGDDVDRNGKPFADREGYAGCYVLTISTEMFAPPIYKNEGGKYRQLEAREIKTGDFAVVKILTKYNGATGTQTPGIYVNPVAIELVAYGAEIISTGVDPDEAFGGRTYQLPAGASAMPVHSTQNGHAPGMTTAAPVAASPAPVPAPVAAPAPVPAAAPVGMPPGFPVGR